MGQTEVKENEKFPWLMSAGVDTWKKAGLLVERKLCPHSHAGCLVAWHLEQSIPLQSAVYREVLLCAHQSPLPVCLPQQALPVSNDLWMVMNGNVHECIVASAADLDQLPECHLLNGTAQNSWLPEVSSVPSKMLDILQRFQAFWVGSISLRPFLLFCHY